MKLPAYSDHIIKAREGAEMVRTFDTTQAVEPSPWRSLMFNADAFRVLLEDPDIKGLKVARATNGNATTVVIFGTDDTGHIIGSLAIENGVPCPPTC